MNAAESRSQEAQKTAARLAEAAEKRIWLAGELARVREQEARLAEQAKENEEQYQMALKMVDQAVQMAGARKDPFVRLQNIRIPMESTNGSAETAKAFRSHVVDYGRDYGDEGREV